MRKYVLLASAATSVVFVLALVLEYHELAIGSAIVGAILAVVGALRRPGVRRGNPRQRRPDGRYEVDPGNLSIEYTILTAPRQPDTLSLTIRSLTETGFFKRPENLPVRLVAGSPHCNLDLYDDSRFEIDLMSRREASRFNFSSADATTRALFGHRRALRAEGKAEFRLVLEDDLRFAEGWMERLNKILRAAQEEYGDRFLLSLYLPGPETEPIDAYNSGSHWIRYPHLGFFGSQAILYPASVREDFMRATASCADTWPHDMALGRTLLRLGIPILATAPSLVQHVGLADGLTRPPHESASFIESVTA
jgi:hypothetical protein